MNPSLLPQPLLSAVMPCLNEERTLGICITKAQAAFAEMGVTGEVVVADNGSTDKSVEIATRLGARVVTESRKGYGAALQAGIGAARGEYIIMADADDSYDWSALSPFVQALREGNDLVIGNRFLGGIEPGSMPWLHRYVGNPLLSFISRCVFHVKLGDFHCGMRAFTRQAYARMAPQTPGMEYATEMIARAAHARLRIAELPIRLYPDKRGRPPHLRTFRDGWRHLRFIAAHSPRYMFFVPGAVLLCIGILLQAKPVLASISEAMPMHVWQIAVGAMLSVLGVNAMGMGVVLKKFLTTRYPLSLGERTQRALRLFTLERGLFCGAALFIVPTLMLEVSGIPEDRLLRALLEAELAACGLSVMLFSFALLLVSSHDESGKHA